MLFLSIPLVLQGDVLWFFIDALYLVYLGLDGQGLSFSLVDLVLRRMGEASTFWKGQALDL